MSFNGSYKQGLAWNACHDPTADELFFGGGARSGKSIFICAHEIIEAVAWPGTRGLIGRKEYTTLRDSTMQTWWEVMTMFGYRAGIDYKWNGADQECRWSNGSLTMFRHLKPEPADPNYTRLGQRHSRGRHWTKGMNVKTGSLKCYCSGPGSTHHRTGER